MLYNNYLTSMQKVPLQFKKGGYSFSTKCLTKNRVFIEDSVTSRDNSIHM